MNLMLMAKVTFLYYCVFLLLQEIWNLVKRVTHKYNDHDNEDRLSDLPDCVLLHIISSLNTKDAIQTCVLSKRWKNLWKRVPSLIISDSHFKDLRGFENFCHGFLGTRDPSSALHVLDFHQEDLEGDQSHLEWIVRYAFSHNVKQVRIDVIKIQDFQSYFFSCDTLTSLDISVDSYSSQRTLFPNSLNFQALTNLSLKSFYFCESDDGRVEPFSAFKRLNSLILQYCTVLGKQNLCIMSATLANLTIDHGRGIDNCNLELYAPNLCTFFYKGNPSFHQLCWSKSNLSSVKHATIDVLRLSESAKDSLILYNWLVELANIESLTIYSTFLEILNSDPNILKVEFPSLYNLKSLKVKTWDTDPSIPKEYLNVLLQNAPSAKVDLILCKLNIVIEGCKLYTSYVEEIVV